MSDPNPMQVVGQMIAGNWVSQVIYVVAKLGIADHLKAGPRSVADLAKETQTHAPTLNRVLRAAAGVGVFTEQSDGVFANTPLSDTLRADTPGSQRAMAIMNGEDFYSVWGRLLDATKTGEVQFDKVYGAPPFDWLQAQPEKAANFDQAMVSVHGREGKAIAEAYDFSKFKTITDVGGGNGSLLIDVLRKHEGVKGLLFDLPGVVERAKPMIAAAGLASRCAVVAGSFFDHIPPGGDAYMMRHIIHDWDEEKCLKILANTRKAMPADGKLLVIETVIPPGNTPSMAKMLDLTMLLIPGGMERTEKEYRALFEKAGFTLDRVVPTTEQVSVIEGSKA